MLRIAREDHRGEDKMLRARGKMATQRGRAPPEELRQAKQNKKQKHQTNKKQKAPPRTGSLPTKTIKTSFRRQRRRRKPKHNQITCEAAAAVCGASSMGMFYLLVSPRHRTTLSAVSFLLSPIASFAYTSTAVVVCVNSIY